MRRTFGLIVLLSLLIANSITVMAKSQNSAISNETTVSSPTRLVVFESFLRSTCGNCKAAGPEIDQLARILRSACRISRL